MEYQEWLDSKTIYFVFLTFFFCAAVIWEAGYRIGRGWQRRTADEKEGPTNMFVGSLLGLLAFLLGITMGMASDRFDTRRAMVLTEANAIGTAYLRAGFLPDAEATKSRSLLREYTSLRYVPHRAKDVPQRVTRSLELHDELWGIAERLAHSLPESVILALYIDSLNQMIDLHGSRLTAAMYARLPPSIFLLLLICAMLTLSMVGYSAGLGGQRSRLVSTVMFLVLAAIITLLIDLDNSGGGLVTVNQQPLLDLQESMADDSGKKSH